MRVQGVQAERQDLLLFHSEEYYKRIEQADMQAEGHVLADGTTCFGKGNLSIARLATGSALKLTEQVMKGELDNAYGLINPAGHHAEPGQGMGLCMFNNIAICAEAAIKKFGARRVTIVDFDVHHGNGTEAGFITRPDILTISIHQDRCYPMHEGAGASSVRGVGPGTGHKCVSLVRMHVRFLALTLPV